jgi:hypothetical protein
MQRQARAPTTRPFGAEAFEAGDGTVLRWLGMAGFLINSRGTTLMVDPLLGGFDMPVMIEFPIAAAEVPRLDACWSPTATMTTTAFPRVVILPGSPVSTTRRSTWLR